MSGGDGADTLNGAGGADTLIGGDGNDSYVVDNAGDVVTETADPGVDTVMSSVSRDLGIGSNVENLTLTGAKGIAGTGNELDNEIVGNDGANLLSGGDGADRLVGRSGKDTLTGGADSDTFVFGLPSDGPDKITDFVSGVDWLEFSAAGFGGDLVAGFPAVLVEAAKSATATAPPGTLGYFIFDNAGSSQGNLYWDGNGGNGADAVLVAGLTGVTSLMARDLKIV